MVTMSLWNEPHRGRHHYAAALSKKHQVLWVNRRLYGGESGPTDGEVESVSESLHVLHTGRSLLSPRIDERLNWNNRRRFSWLLRVLQALGDPDMIWIYDYKAIQFACWFKGKATTLYFCNDCFGEYAYKHYEVKLAKIVDYVFATAPGLRDRLLPYNSRSFFLPHGVWLPDHAPVFTKKIKPEVVGYVGVLREVVDIAYLEKIVEETDLKLVLAGPITECSSSFRKKLEILFRNPKVDYLGDLSPGEQKKVIAQLDICLLPYVCNALLSHGFSIKYFDYLAVAKPIVATPYFSWPSPFGEFVDVYDGRSDLREFFAVVYSNWDLSRFTRAVELAGASTWDHRVRTVGEMINMDL